MTPENNQQRSKLFLVYKIKMLEYVNYYVFLVLQGFHHYFGEELFWDTSLSNDTYFQGMDRNASEPKQSGLPNYVFVRSSK